MTVFIALLRTVEAGGMGKFFMADLKDLCEKVGFKKVRTYMISGGAVFASDQSEAEVKAVLEASLLAYSGKLINVLVRTAAEVTDVLSRNPFPAAKPNRTVAIFLDTPPAENAIQDASGRAGEEIQLGAREIYVYYDKGMASSKLRIQAAKSGSARNMIAVAKMARMAEHYGRINLRSNGNPVVSGSGMRHKC